MSTMFVVGYSALSKETGVHEAGLMYLAAMGRLPLLRHRAGNDVAFERADVARWVEEDCPGTEWVGESLAIQNADIHTRAEGIVGALHDLTTFRNGVFRVSQWRSRADIVHLMHTVDTILDYAAMLRGAVGIALIHGMSGRPHKIHMLRPGSKEWFEAAGEGWLEGTEDAGLRTGQADLVYEPLQKFFSEFGWELRRKTVEDKNGE